MAFRDVVVTYDYAIFHSLIAWNANGRSFSPDTPTRVLVSLEFSILTEAIRFGRSGNKIQLFR
jgi:hypothetical protein